MGFDEQAFKDEDEEMIDQALSDVTNPHLADVTYETLKEQRFMKASHTGDFLNSESPVEKSNSI